MVNDAGRHTRTAGRESVDARASARPPAAGAVDRRLLGGAFVVLGAGAALAYLLRREGRRPPQGGPHAATLRTHHREIAGVRMRWLEHGHGQPVVLVHGIPTSPELWRKVMPRLRGARALAWEMVGYGASIPEGAGRDISLSRQADYLAAWMRSLELGPAVLAGHDLGGGVAQIVAARHPELCAGLLLTNAVCYDSWPIPEVDALRALGGAVAKLPPAGVALVHEVLYRRGHDDRRARRASARRHRRHYRRADAGRAFLRQLRSLDARDTLEVQERLPHLGVPARVVWGTADPFQKLRYGERLARDLGAPLRRIEGGRHFTPEDHPAEIAEELNDLLQEVRAEAAARASTQGG